MKTRGRLWGSLIHAQRIGLWVVGSSGLKTSLATKDVAADRHDMMIPVLMKW